MTPDNPTRIKIETLAEKILDLVDGKTNTGETLMALLGAAMATAAADHGALDLTCVTALLATFIENAAMNVDMHPLAFLNHLSSSMISVLASGGDAYAVKLRSQILERSLACTCPTCVARRSNFS